MDEDDECDHEFEEIQVATKRLSPWNAIGICLTTTAGIMAVLNQGLNQAAVACWAHANWKDWEREDAASKQAQEDHRREMARALDGLTGMNRKGESS